MSRLFGPSRLFQESQPEQVSQRRVRVIPTLFWFSTSDSWLPRWSERVWMEIVEESLKIAEREIEIELNRLWASHHIPFIILLISLWTFGAESVEPPFRDERLIAFEAESPYLWLSSWSWFSDVCAHCSSLLLRSGCITLLPSPISDEEFGESDAVQPFASQSSP